MDDAQFKALMKAIAGSKEAGKVETTIDRVIPLPIGSKSLIGILGSLLSGGLLQSGAISGTEAQPIVELALYAFFALGGAGLVSKFQRAIDVLQRLLSYAPQIDAMLSRIEEEAKRWNEARQ